VAASFWSLWVWIVFILIQVRSPDPDATLGFKVVHFTLAGISILFAIAVGRIAWRALRPRPEPPSSHTAMTGAEARAGAQDGGPEPAPRVGE
jgi:cytochrome b561